MTLTELGSLFADWRRDPCLFVRQNFQVEPDPWQRLALDAFADPSKQRISLQACVGPGKTAVLAWCAWNFLACYGEHGDHPHGLAVAITGANLDDNLWPELAKWRDRSPFLTRAFDWTKTRIISKDHPENRFLSARTWSKNASPEEQGRTLSGLHGAYVIALVDESGDIPEAVLKAADQALSNCKFGKILQGGNPTSLEGMLNAARTRLRKLWHIIRVTGDPDDPMAWVNAPSVLARVGTGPREWAQEQIALHGRDNPWVMSQILGEFPPASINALLGPEDVEAAMARALPEEAYRWAQCRIGVDVARFGDDRTVLFPRQGSRAYMPAVMRHARDSAVSTDIATRVLKLQDQLSAKAVIMDATGGWAAGARDVLVASGQAPVNVQFHHPSVDGRYKNLRAEMWFAMAEWVKAGGWLPNLPDLIGELSAPTYTFINGKFQLEPKEQVKARIGRSPDLADALALTFGIPEVAPEPYSEPYSPSSAWS